MRVVVAMSGGVDSSVSALLLREQGHDVVGVFLRNGVEAAGQRGRAQGCCGATDALDAEEVAGALGIPFHSLDHARDFARIVDDFVAAYARGETPNPCVQCNRELKFGALLRFADALGAPLVATGHYARLAEGPDGVELHRAVDRAKDQSYVLADVPAAALARARFPVGGLAKEEVRERARRAGLPVHAKPESQELCFVPGGDHRELLRARRPDLMQPGPVLDADGAEVGRHDGALGFTRGQRRGLRLAFGEPRYVLAAEPQRARVVVGTRAQLLAGSAKLVRCNWLAPPPRAGDRVELQVRAHHAPVAADVTASADEAVTLALAPPGEQVTPGQLGVLYAGTRVLASGTFAS